MTQSNQEKSATGVDLEVVIMAAGKGTRMRSPRPKVLHVLGGRALLAHVLDTTAALRARRVVVITGHGAIEVEAAVASHTGITGQLDVNCVVQQPQLGTGHAVQQAIPWLSDDALVLILSGDVPLTRVDTLRELVAASAGERLALLTLDCADPSGYGRIVRDGAAVRAIVEDKDATVAQRAITEIYSGIMVAPARWLKTALARLDQRNAQGEYYLTDVVARAVSDGVPVLAHRITDATQVAGVNTLAQLAELERAYQRRVAQQLMEQGVQLLDPSRLDVRGALQCGTDVQIDVNCVFEGEVTLGAGVRIGANCFIANARIEDAAVIYPFTHIAGSASAGQGLVVVGRAASVGPYARLRAGARLGADVHIGNFVEVKNASLAQGAKANHLAYLGDATVGERVNFGAGSITANYDGAHKHRTVIEADVHVGSNCVLVAPLTLGAGGTVGGGSTLTKSTAPAALTVARAKQVSVANWKRPSK